VVAIWCSHHNRLTQRVPGGGGAFAFVASVDESVVIIAPAAGSLTPTLQPLQSHLNMINRPHGNGRAARRLGLSAKR
jgi:hypothetical protein